MMNVMTGSTGDPFGHMLGLHPVSILVVMALAEVLCIVLYDVAFFGIFHGLVIRFEGPAGCIPHRPSGIFDFGGGSPVVARTADLRGHAQGQLGGVDDGLSFFEHGGLGQGGVP